MAPRWLRSKQLKRSQYDEDEFLLFSGKLIVGRVYQNRTGPEALGFIWSLVGFADPVVPSRGTADSEDAAKAQLPASWRQWQAWTGMRDAD